MPYDINATQKRLADLTREVEIDKHDLDNELMDQPALFNEISQEYVRALAQRDLLKQELDLVRAQTDRRLRERYTADGVKYTETLLANEVLMSKDFQEIQAAFSAWRHLADAWQALKEAFGQRAYALRELASLYTAGYYSVEATREPLALAQDRKAARVRAAIAQRETQKGTNS